MPLPEGSNLFHREGNLMDLSIRDGVAHISSIQKTGGLYIGMFTINNTLDQAVTILVEASRDAAFTIPIQRATYVLGIATKKVDTLSDPWRWVRYTITAAGVPTVGKITIDFDGEGDLP